jgi:multisubunit Na+/H+ antiporter MnhC subunit
MKKGLIITFAVIGVAVTAFILKEKFRKKRFNKNCLEGGGTIEEDGRRCISGTN